MKQYKCGYCAIVADTVDFRAYRWMREVAVLCDRFVLGIPDNQAMELIPEVCSGYDMEAVKEYWADIKWVDEIVVLTQEQFSYQKAYEIIGFDVCLYGSEYGLSFLQDKAFMERHGVTFVSAVPEKMQRDQNVDAFGFVLKNYYFSRKIVLFGTGGYFDHYMAYYGSEYKPVYAIDNSKNKWGASKEGIPIKAPSELKQENPEEILVILCSKNYGQMAEQLAETGQYEYRPLLRTDRMAVLENYRVYQKVLTGMYETLDKIQKINCDMLKIVDQICRTNGIVYFLNFGSLLGAIRHKGFIPWDNDVDLLITRKNYEKFLEHQDDLDSGKYYILKPDFWGNRKYYDSVPRLEYKGAYIRLEEEECRFYENHNNRIHMDFFLIDKTYDNFRGKLQRFELAVLYGLMNAYRHESFFFDYDKKMRIANGILRKAGRCIPLNWMRKRADKVARRFEHDSQAPYYFISNDVLGKLKMLFPREILDHSVDLPFEDMMASVAVGYKELCGILFGDYMKLPPVSMRVPHLGRRLITSDLYVFHEPEGCRY